MIGESLQEECGIFGIISPENKRVGNITYFGLYALQHRGQESAGIAVSNEKGNISFYKRMGVVSEVFSEDILEELTGNAAIGHVRYSTSGQSTINNAQPLVSDFKYGMVGFAHNGNIVNAEKLKKQLENQGAIFQTDSDSEVLLHLIARNTGEDFLTALKQEILKLEGAFSIVMIQNGRLIAVKDKNSIRPLCLGKLKDDYIVASESCALDMIDAEYIREINPGEILVINPDGKMESSYYAPQTKKNVCVFEYIYFSRPDSVIFEHNVHGIRKVFGRKLAEIAPVEADVVVPVPDSGISAAMGYSEFSGIPYDKGIIRNHYIGRTFIAPMQELRNMKVKMKLNPVKAVVKGKKVVLVDDSIVRGTTSKKLVKLLRGAGAKEIHFRISSPPVVGPCFFGIDTPDENELIASKMDEKQIAEFIGADSVAYLKLPYLKECMSKSDYCYDCFIKRKVK